MDLLSAPVEKILKIKKPTLKKLHRLGIKTLKDFFYHFPHRYEDFSKIVPISQVKIFEKNCILGKILAIKNSKTPLKKMVITQAIVQDKTGSLKVVWFNQPYLTKILKKGDYLCLAGKAEFTKEGIFLSNPVYEKIRKKEKKSFTHTGRIVPIYPETEGISSRWLRNKIKQILSKFSAKVPEILPLSLIKKFNLMPIKKAIWQIHFPNSLELAKKAKERFSFEEIFFIELSVLKEKLALAKEKAPAILINIELMRKFVSSLPFKLTDAQRKVAWQILKDLEKPIPMSRLLQGDVGSGKTVVAVMVSLNVVKAGYQVAFMAPTEILAKQHFQEISKLLAPFKIKIALLTGKEDKIISQKLKGEVLEISRKKLLERVREKEIDILVGTHTLIQEKVKFKKLALCIIDEQHRFGVEQRAKLLVKRDEGTERLIPHFLSITATPIPRSLALTLYGNLDLSLIDELPKGRKKIITKIVPPKEREEVYRFVKEQAKLKNQTFIICPRIEQGKTKDRRWAQLKAVEKETEFLAKEIFPELKVAMLHGRMRPKEKEKIMKDFKNKKIDILVSTSVVEVGIDIPSATVMIIEDAERFGLAQLYQLRGRVGRSDLQSFCFLFTNSNSQKAYRRLKAIIEAEDGFSLSQKDLAIRGPGSLYGTKQWGIPDFAMEALSDIKLVEKARSAAKEILLKDFNLKNFPYLKKELERIQKKVYIS